MTDLDLCCRMMESCMMNLAISKRNFVLKHSVLKMLSPDLDELDGKLSIVVFSYTCSYILVLFFSDYFLDYLQSSFCSLIWLCCVH
jgi:hypothetical protein